MFTHRRYAFLAASFAVLVACSGDEEGSAEAPHASHAGSAEAPPTPREERRVVENVQSAPIATPALVVDAGAPAVTEDASVEPIPCLSCSAKLDEPSAKGELCSSPHDSKALYARWIACACGPCTDACGADLCSGKPAVPSETCTACLGYASQICFEENKACKADTGVKK